MGYASQAMLPIALIAAARFVQNPIGFIALAPVKGHLFQWAGSRVNLLAAAADMQEGYLTLDQPILLIDLRNQLSSLHLLQSLSSLGVQNLKGRNDSDLANAHSPPAKRTFHR